MRRSVTLPLVLAAVFLFAAAGPAQAAPGPPQHVDLFGCSAFAGGEWTIKHGKDVYLRYGWATNTYRQLRQFMNVATVIVRVDGVRIAHQSARWNLPEHDEEFNFWAAWWSARIPKFADNESRTVTVQVDLAKRHFDGIGYYGPGKIYQPRLSCVVTAE